ncbi:MAG: ATP-binding protein [Sandaracinaceae bacterium]|nr:ATP-binding protein [Sandaracinaceae bacterium]
MAHDLHPYELDRLGLSEAVRSAALRALEAAGIDPEVVVADVDGLVPPASALHVHRILQEALSNVIRHSGATSATVALRRSGDALELLVEDDGRGLGDSREGFGTASMRERADAIGATLELDDARGGGTRVRLEVPVTI